MGLLDEAIREHLELKRRRGADPSVVAREEREALAPVPGDNAAFEVDDEGRDDVIDAEREHAAAALAPAGAQVEQGDPQAERSHLSEETAELDMQAVMEEEPRGRADVAGDDSDPQSDGLEPVTRAGDEPALGSFDWELPEEQEREERLAPEDVPGQERLSFE